jgi:hypothetical protein
MNDGRARVLPEMKIQVLMSPGCGHGERAVELVEDAVRVHAPTADIQAVMVATSEGAARLAFPGSPTIRVNGIDIDPHAPTNIGLG